MKIKNTKWNAYHVFCWENGLKMSQYSSLKLFMQNYILNKI